MDESERIHELNNVRIKWKSFCCFHSIFHCYRHNFSYSLPHLKIPFTSNDGLNLKNFSFDLQRRHCRMKFNSRHDNRYRATVRAHMASRTADGDKKTCSSGDIFLFQFSSHSHFPHVHLLTRPAAEKSRTWAKLLEFSHDISFRWWKIVHCHSALNTVVASNEFTAHNSTSSPFVLFAIWWNSSVDVECHFFLLPLQAI